MALSEPVSSASPLSATSHPRRYRSRRAAARGSLVFSGLVALVSLSSVVRAYDIYPPEITPPAYLDPLPEELLVDTGGPVWADEAVLPVLLDDDVVLRRRQQDDGGQGDSKTKSGDDDQDTKTKSGDDDGDDTKTQSDDGDAKATKTVGDEPSGPLTTNAEAETAAATATEAAATAPLPSAFDMTPSSEFKSEGEDNSCPSFVSNLLASSTYQDCYPISTMLLTSSGLFDAEKQLTSIVQVLDATCAADVDTCTDFLSQAASNLTSDANCKQEYEDGVDLVMQMYEGLVSYQVLYSASCLQDPDADMYCLASAVTNTTQPSDYSLYFMPLGLGLPGGSSPSCNWCVTETMGIFRSATADRDQPIADVYVEAAQQVNTVCGPNSVNTTLAEETSAADRRSMPASAIVLASFCATLLLNCVL